MAILAMLLKKPPFAAPLALSLPPLTQPTLAMTFVHDETTSDTPLNMEDIQVVSAASCELWRGISDDATSAAEAGTFPFPLLLAALGAELTAFNTTYTSNDLCT